MSRAEVELVVFRAGGVSIAVEATQVSSCRVMDRRQAPKEIVDVETLIGLTSLEAKQNRSRQVLYVRRRAAMEGGIPAERAIRVDAPVELMLAPVEALHPLPELLAARTGLRHLRGLACLASEDASGRSLTEMPGMSLLVDIQAALASEV